MRILVGYATTDGQTRKVARFAADRLAGAGHMVELLSLEDAEGLDLARFDRAILAASVHASGYQKEFKRFCADNAGALNDMPTLFLSVSLTASGSDVDDWKALRGIVRELAETTRWTPGQTEHVAGAFRFSEYNVLEAWVMRWIAAQKEKDVDGKTDKEYTDWAALGALLDDWTAEAGAGKEAGETV